MLQRLITPSPCLIILLMIVSMCVSGIAEANNAPNTVGPIPAKTVGMGTTQTMNLLTWFNDIDGDALTYTATSADTGIATVSVSDTTLTLTPVAVGTVTITLTGTDPGGLSATHGFSLTVQVNEAPTAKGTIPDQLLTPNGNAVSIDAYNYFSDPEGDALSYSAASSDTAIATTSISGSWVSVSPLAKGTATITVTATDLGGLSADQTFSVLTDQPPTTVGTIPDQEVMATKTLSLNVSSYFSDPEGDALTYAATSDDTATADVTVSNDTVALQGKVEGTATITVTVTDTSGSTATQTFALTVTPFNSPPVPVGTIPDQSVVDGGEAATVDLTSYFGDGADDTLTYTAASSDTAIATVSVSDVTVSVSPVSAGTATITVTATDTAGSTATQTFSVSVRANQAPTLSTPFDSYTAEGPSSISIDLSGHFSDPDGDSLTYTASTTDSSIGSVSISGSTLTIGVAGVGWNVGVASITATASDPYGKSAGGSFPFTRVHPPGQSPGDENRHPGGHIGQADAVPGLSSTEQLLLGQLLTYDTIIFNELSNSSDDTNDWLELRNVSNIDIPIDNWQLTVQTGSDTAVIPFPAGTAISAGDVLLLTNTKMAAAAVVVEDFVLPQTEFALILRSPTVFGDIAGNYFQTEKERPETAPELTADTVWERVEVTVSGYRAEAWAVSTHRNGLGSPGYHPSALLGDLNHDGVVDILDLVLVASQFGMTGITAADLNGDNTVNIQDLVLVANASSNVAAAPSANQSTAALVNTWLQLAQQNASSTVQTSLPKGFSYERGIHMLEQLLAALVPDTTALLANYPNPFNPETWIPYQLSKAADVAVTIYAADGSVVRTLALGHQDAGMYKNRTQAAYWDGKNALGESVASGVYFYTLTAGDFAATRKMLILK